MLVRPRVCVGWTEPQGHIFNGLVIGKPLKELDEAGEGPRTLKELG